MAKDHYTSGGLNTPRMMEAAMKYRDEFDMLHVELVDIVAILEFKLVKLFPDFRLVIKRDADMAEDAVTETHKSRITLKTSVYIAACQGNAEARFVLAHELGHFLLHRDKAVQMHMDKGGYEQAIRNLDSTQRTEAQADMFARHFLAPPALAFRYRDSPEELAQLTGIPLGISRGNITMSTRPEVYFIRMRENGTKPSLPSFPILTE